MNVMTQPGSAYSLEKREEKPETHTMSVLVDNEPGVLAMVIEQIKHQLERLVPVHSVTDLTLLGNPVERELALVKVAGKGEKRVEALRLAEAFRASVIDASTEHFIFEITGKFSKIEQFIVLMQPLGLVEVSRTGLAAIARGSERM
jgi:acetolactate synthase-1/3 small subunit